jgi:hypothetical protein
MKAKIKYVIFIKEDIKRAVNCYNKSQDGLGAKFLRHIKDEINYIAENAETIQVRYQDVQMAVVKIFPYTIHFQYFKQENTLHILGIFHTSISPDKWLKRL